MKLEASAAHAQSQLEQQATKLALTEKENAGLTTQLKNLREAKSYLYAFHLFDDRYKCGVTDNPDKREKQHRTSCPSGRMVHTVVIACKQSEKLLDSIMRSHGNHVRQEEYEIPGGENRVKLILNTVARMEETLHGVPFERYGDLLKYADEILQTQVEDVTPSRCNPERCVSGPFSPSPDGRDEQAPLDPIAQWLADNSRLTGIRKNKARFPAVLDYYEKVQKEKKLDCKVQRNRFYKSLRHCGLETSNGANYDVLHGIILKRPNARSGVQ